MMMMPPEVLLMPPAEPKRIDLLVVADSHVNGEELNKMAQWLHESKKNFDYVVIAGNMANMTNEHRSDVASEYLALDQVVGTLQFFLDHVKKPVFYVPGNTEPTMIFDYQPEMPNVVNLHKRAVPLEKNLVLVGLGGCPPAKKDDKDVLEGFPYKDDSEFKKDADTCVEAALKQFGTETDVVLLTHLGPDSSATTKVQLETEKLEAGSKGLSETIKKNADNIICNIHGHSALAEGFDKPYSPKLPIINPGGLTSGRFAEVTLANLPSGRWRVASMKFNSFPSFQTHGSFHL